MSHIEKIDSKWPLGVKGSTLVFDLWYLVALEGLGIWVSVFKIKIGWPQQTPTEKVLNFKTRTHSKLWQKIGYGKTSLHNGWCDEFETGLNIIIAIFQEV